MRTQSKTMWIPEARENAVNQDAIDFSFESDWLIEGCKFFWIIGLRKAKPKQLHLNLISNFRGIFISV